MNVMRADTGTNGSSKDKAQQGMPPSMAGQDAHACPAAQQLRPNALFDCGWGRLLFAPSFASHKVLAETLLGEAPGKRDIAFYVDAPQVVLAEAPADLFLDPSLILRRQLDHDAAGAAATEDSAAGISVRTLTTRSDIAAINRLYSVRGMVPLDPKIVWAQRHDEAVMYLVAEAESSGDIIGSVIAIDHGAAFGDASGGSSLWCLVVDPQTGLAGAGRSLISHALARLAERGCNYVDLSVMHNNDAAIGLYQKLGFAQTSGFAIKHKNAINERLFVDSQEFSGLNPYARLIVDEARRRGIGVEVLDTEAGIFKLRYCGQEMLCRESLTELTGGVAMSWCQDKVLTSRRLNSVGIRVPQQQLAADAQRNAEFLSRYGSVVVKPAMGEQGHGVSVDVRTEQELAAAVTRAAAEGGHVVLEEYCAGNDLRVVVIGYRVVAAAMRRPAEVTGNGSATIAELIERQSARRAAATGGESTIPKDAETERSLRAQGLSYASIPPDGVTIAVRKTANLHSGGTIHDVTDKLSPKLREVSEAAARALRIPVTGLDFLVSGPEAEDYVLIEANERPGLANHEPQPTAQRFIDLLFPLTA